MNSVEPLSISPLAREVGNCPLDGGRLESAGLHLAGWRTLVRGRCQSCGHQFLQDAPAGHGLLYPASLDLDTGITHADPPTEWFSRALLQYYQAPDSDRVDIEVDERRPLIGPSVLLNCLDVVYGHALLKLLNAGRYRETSLIAIVPAALAPLVPAHVAEVWIVHAGFQRLARWLLEVEWWIADRLAAIDGAVVLGPAFPHPHPSTYDLGEYTEGIEPSPRGDPSVVLALRGDRRWGRTSRAQNHNVHEFICRMLDTYPHAGFTVLGLSPPGGLGPEVDDQRMATPDAARERSWLASLLGADLAVGVHGSHLLLPSGLANATIELLPRDRYGNFLQATLVRQDDPVAALEAHRTVYGDQHLTDVDGSRVGGLAAVMIGEKPRFEEVMYGRLAGLDVPSRDIGGAAPVDPDLRPGALVRAAPRVRELAARGLRARSVFGAYARRGLAATRARRIRSFPVVLTDTRGARFEVGDREEAGIFLEHGGHFEAQELDLLRRYLRPGDLALDVGANIGHVTVTMARAVGPGGSVHAFEPLLFNVERLERTVELNGLTNVNVHGVAVGAKAGEVELTDYGPRYPSWATTRPRSTDPRQSGEPPPVTHSVPLVTVDEYCRQRGIRQIAALKIDVEGAERDVLEGARHLLDEGAIDLLLVEASDNTGAGNGRAWELIEFLGRPPRATYLLSGSELVPFRVAGDLDFANVVAVSPAGRARLGL